jgi:serine/threonine protein kinase
MTIPPPPGPASSAALPAALSAPPRGDMGQILLRQGAVTPAQLEECLKIQQSMAGQAHVPRLGELMVQKGYTTKDAIRNALAEQNKKVLLCSRCNIMVTVNLRPDAIGYKCGKCETILIEPSPDRVDDSIDSMIIVASSAPVPPDVIEARKDPANRFGKYVLLGEIGRGGIGTIYRAWDVYLNQLVALKRIKPPPQGSGKAVRHTRVASLLNEAHNAIKLRHPNIVSIYDIGRIEDEYYISMEFLDGRTMLEEIQECKKAGKVSPFHENPRKWMGVLYEVAQALHYAHTRPTPLLHCDLKPANIMVTGDSRACILDFGLARQLGEIKTEQGVVSGTPSYMAPEQAAGRNDLLDPRTDVYGLGSILYEMLAGQPPFVGEVMDVLRRVQDEKPKAPSDLAWGRDAAAASSRRMLVVPPELEALCLRALSKDPQKRPANALAFAEDLANVAGGGKRSLPKMAAVPTLQSGIHDIAVSLGARKGKWVPMLLVVFLMLIAVSATLVFYPRIRGWFDSGSATEKAMKYLADFRPDLIDELDKDVLKRPEFGEILRRRDLIADFKQQIIDRIEATNPWMPKLSIGSKVEKGVTLQRGQTELVIYQVGQQVADQAPWSKFGPTGIREMAQFRTEKLPALLDSPRNKFALALYALSANYLPMARELLRDLKGTQFEGQASEYLRQINEGN